MNGTNTTTSNSLTLTFPEPGRYRVEISGAFPRIFFNNMGDKDKILTVEQWGNIAWISMDSAFYGAASLRIPATDAPNLSGVAILYNMFNGAIVFNDPINHWDMSNATVTANMFAGATSFNQPLNLWNVSSIVTVNSMFYNATSFNQSLNSWNTSNVTNMSNVFFGATSFNQSLNNWSTVSVTTMSNMFRDATSFNQPINSWDTSSVLAMPSMFVGATAFNQDLSQWNIASLNMSHGGSAGLLASTSLSTRNQDTLLVSWATQAATHNIENILLHIGVKNYSETGATALTTLRSLGWTITEQYQATYTVEPGATLTGTSHQLPLNTGDTTTAITITPDPGCTFTGWSDGNTDNPRQDTITTDNVAVTAVINCPSSSSGTTAAGQALAKARQSLTTTTPTLDTTLASIQSLIDNPIDPNTTDPETLKKLIALLAELIHLLTQLVVRV